jgi:hypothetical protein
MSNRIPAVLALALCTFVLFGCDGSSPTDPVQGPTDLTGTWEGGLSAFPTDEDWSRVRLSVQTTGATTTGTLTSRNGVAHPVTGQNAGSTTPLEVGGLPQQAPCSVTLIVKRVDSSAMLGSLSGRCPNTLMSNFRLEKSP